MPDHKCNWIYEQKSYQNMHENFSENYVKCTEFETKRAHNMIGVNNCVAIITPLNIIKKLNLQEINYNMAKNIISDKNLSIVFPTNNFIKLYNLFIKINEDNIIIENKFIDNLPYVNKIYSI